MGEEKIKEDVLIEKLKAFLSSSYIDFNSSEEAIRVCMFLNDENDPKINEEINKMVENQRDFEILDKIEVILKKTNQIISEEFLEKLTEKRRDSFYEFKYFLEELRHEGLIKWGKEEEEEEKQLEKFFYKLKRIIKDTTGDTPRILIQLS
ncbi:MAG: hypothetical protein N2203_05240, partial [Bacteroidia bacterium]|nr:hypothetical protein [Bacteroidia bacterium]